MQHGLHEPAGGSHRLMSHEGRRRERMDPIDVRTGQKKQKGG
jgi:hypothetical protein